MSALGLLAAWPKRQEGEEMTSESGSRGSRVVVPASSVTDTFDVADSKRRRKRFVPVALATLPARLFNFGLSLMPVNFYRTQGPRVKWGSCRKSPGTLGGGSANQERHLSRGNMFFLSSAIVAFTRRVCDRSFRFRSSSCLVCLKSFFFF
jgi:hypothetical protein